MRKIRCRAWDGSRFYYFGNYTYTLSYNDICGWNVVPNIPDYKGEWTCGESQSKTPDFDLMEYTDFEDKNGNMVCEGDIIRAILSDYNGDGIREAIEKVEYRNGLLCPFYMRVNFEEDWWKDSLIDGFEIIGNDYEHPELLERKLKA